MKLFLYNYFITLQSTSNILDSFIDEFLGLREIIET